MEKMVKQLFKKRKTGKTEKLPFGEKRCTERIKQ